MFKKLHIFFAYCVVMLARPKEAAEATNNAETPEQLDEYIMAIYRGQTPAYKRK